MKILYAASASPWPTDFGGSMRTAGVLHALERWAAARPGTTIELVVVADEPGAAARKYLAERGAELWATPSQSPWRRAVRIARALATGRSIPAARLAGGRLPARLREAVLASRPDLVILGDTFVAEAAPMLGGLGARIVIDTHNVESLLWHDISVTSRTFLSRAAYRLLAANVVALERRVLPLADSVWAASVDDAAWYRASLGLARVHVVPNALPETPLLEPSREHNAIMMSGLFAYPPNEDAALELLAASRALLERGIAHRLYLVGRSPGPRMIEAARGLDHVEITGAVESIEPWMQRATVFAAPLRAGSGTKFKLLQAMLAGRAIVTTPIGAHGLALSHDRHAVVCSADDFADALAGVLADPARRERLAGEARRHVTEHFCQASLDAAVSAALDAALDASGVAP